MDREPTGEKKDTEGKKGLDRKKIAIERDKHKVNIREVLKYSNSTPIRGHSDSGYGCCFCEESFLMPGDLKKHTLDEHNHENSFKDANFLKRFNLNSYYVRLDTTDMKCKLCNESIDRPEQLIAHLKNVHRKKVYTDLNNRLLPFKFTGDSLRCFICSNVFNAFKCLVEHMSVHYRNFICEICDAGFVTRHMAVSHTQIHQKGTFNCAFCTKVFDTVVKKKLHERNVHTHADRQNRCGICNKTFRYFSHKLTHLSEAHGIDTTAKCQACDRTFVNQKKLRVHVRKIHLMERRYKCTDCEMRFFTSHELENHKVKHTGTRDFQCEVCLKSYGLKKNLQSHMRTHENERRFK